MMILKNTASPDCIKISWYNEKTDLLGPFFRFVLWVQGCERKCPDCIADNMQSLTGGTEIKISELADIILSSHECEGITISGGEPFYQADRLVKLLGEIHSRRPDFGVIIYTGYTYEELKNSDEYSVKELLSLTDILIDGPYISEMDDNRGLRGSSNQNILFLTDRYISYREMYTNPSGRKNKIEIHGNELRMTGVPSLNTKIILQKFN